VKVHPYQEKAKNKFYAGLGFILRYQENQGETLKLQEMNALDIDFWKV
jgi:hypothetical protein